MVIKAYKACFDSDSRYWIVHQMRKESYDLDGW